MVAALATASLLKGSTFQASQHAGHALIHTESPVTLEKITASLDPIMGEADFIKQPGTLEAQIHDEPFSQGTMKLTFDVSTVQPSSFAAQISYLQQWRMLSCQTIL